MSNGHFEISFIFHFLVNATVAMMSLNLVNCDVINTIYRSFFYFIYLIKSK